jgi:hypothetical protein
MKKRGRKAINTYSIEAGERKEVSQVEVGRIRYQGYKQGWKLVFRRLETGNYEVFRLQTK